MEKFEPDLEELRNRINNEYVRWQNSNDPVNRFITIDETRERRYKLKPSIATISELKAQNGMIIFENANRANEQKRLVSYLMNANERLINSINGHLDSQYGNYLAYATNDYCDLEVVRSVIPAAQQRLFDLENYEKYVGYFNTTTLETKTVKKRGILGFFGAKETHQESRKLTQEEFAAKEQEAILKIDALREAGEIDETQYTQTYESIKRLYGEYINTEEETETYAEEAEYEQMGAPILTVEEELAPTQQEEDVDKINTLQVLNEKDDDDSLTVL